MRPDDAALASSRRRLCGRCRPGRGGRDGRRGSLQRGAAHHRQRRRLGRRERGQDHLDLLCRGVPGLFPQLPQQRLVDRSERESDRGYRLRRACHHARSLLLRHLLRQRPYDQELFLRLQRLSPGSVPLSRRRRTDRGSAGFRLDHAQRQPEQCGRHRRHQPRHRDGLQLFRYGDRSDLRRRHRG